MPVGKYRSRIEIIYDILNSIDPIKGSRPLKITSRANLCGNVRQSYLGDVIDLGLVNVEKVNGHRIHTITDKGFVFIKYSNILRQLVKEDEYEQERINRR